MSDRVAYLHPRRSNRLDFLSRAILLDQEVVGTRENDHRYFLYEKGYFKFVAMERDLATFHQLDGTPIEPPTMLPTIAR